MEEVRGSIPLSSTASDQRKRGIGPGCFGVAGHAEDTRVTTATAGASISAVRSLRPVPSSPFASKGTPLLLGLPTPHTKLIGLKRPLQTGLGHRAGGAHRLRLVGLIERRATHPMREKQLRVHVQTAGVLPPAHRLTPNHIRHQPDRDGGAGSDHNNVHDPIHPARASPTSSNPHTPCAHTTRRNTLGGTWSPRNTTGRQRQGVTTTTSPPPASTRPRSALTPAAAGWAAGPRPLQSLAGRPGRLVGFAPPIGVSACSPTRRADCRSLGCRDRLIAGQSSP